ncbi:MAG: endonuclease, partial [Sulfitobacter dubius]
GIGAARKASAPVEPAEETPQQEPTAPVADTAAVEAAPEEVVEAPAEPSEAEPAPVPATDSRSTDGKPALLDAPRAGGADDLKRIGGIGPKLEQTMNELGIYHFDQIAALQGDEIDWVDSRLRFKGRIQRDDWIGQAKALANDGKAGV